MKNVIVSLVALAGVAGAASAQVSQAPIGATLRYEVAINGGAWSNSVDALPGDTVQWRTVVDLNDGLNAAALGRVFYQPILVNADIVDGGNGIDTLGAWRNGGISGQGNTNLALGNLSFADGQNSGMLANGYGRVQYTFSSRSTAAGNAGPLSSKNYLPGFENAPNSVAGITPDAGNGYIRVAGSNLLNRAVSSGGGWYPSAIANGSVALNEQIIFGVVADNNSASSTWFVTGTQDRAVLRQALTVSDNDAVRTITITSEAATLQRQGGAAGTDDLRFMTWALTGEGGSTATLRVGVEIIGATVNIVPTPGAVALLGLGGLVAARRRRA